MILNLCVPAYRDQVHWGHIGQTAGLQASCDRSGAKLIFSMVNSCFLDLSRNSLLWSAVNQNKADWALFADADTYTLKPDNIVGMLNEAHVRGAAVVAAPVPIRKSLHERKLIYNAQIGDDWNRYLDKADFEGQVISVDRVGTALMAIDCNWLRQHWPQQPWFESKPVADSPFPMKMSEDYLFCQEVKRRGGLILLDGRFEPMHAGVTNELMTLIEPATVTIRLGERNGQARRADLQLDRSDGGDLSTRVG